MKVTVQKAINLIKNGKNVAFPTETVYGLGADAFNVEAVKKTFQKKGRPPDNPLIVHISRFDQLQLLVTEIPDAAVVLAEKFWPGPLTMVFNKSEKVPDIVTGGLPSVAVRMPDHPLALDIINQTGPLTAPSANPSGKPSPTRPDHLITDYGDTLPYVDGGKCKVGIESTVLDLITGEPAILRPGVISDKMIAGVLNYDVLPYNDNDTGTIRSPGTKYTHYKPVASVHWCKKLPANPIDDHYYIMHSESALNSTNNIYSYNGNFEKLARNLYDHFRDADFKNCTDIFIETLPDNHTHPAISALKNRIGKSVGG